MAKGFDITVDDGASKPLRDVIAKVTHPAPIFDAVGADLEAQVQIGFVAGHDPYGTPWAQPKFRPGQPLRDTGRLMASITHNADDRGLEVGTNVCYAPIHQFGGTISAQPGNAGSSSCGPRKGAPFLVFKAGGQTVRAKSVTIPARPFLPTAERGMPDTWWDMVRDRVAAELGV